MHISTLAKCAVAWAALNAWAWAQSGESVRGAANAVAEEKAATTAPATDADVTDDDAAENEGDAGQDDSADRRLSETESQSSDKATPSTSGIDANLDGVPDPEPSVQIDESTKAGAATEPTVDKPTVDKLMSIDQGAARVEQPAVRGETRENSETSAQARARANRWRYVRHSGRWWFWTPDRRWLYWSGSRWYRYDGLARRTGESQYRDYQGSRGERNPDRYYGDRSYDRYDNRDRMTRRYDDRFYDGPYRGPARIYNRQPGEYVPYNDGRWSRERGRARDDSPRDDRDRGMNNSKAGNRALDRQPANDGDAQPSAANGASGDAGETGSD